MPFLPSSGPLSINDIRNLFGGPASPSMANYYRGGAYVPSTKTVTTRDPTSGEYFALGPFFSDLRYWGVRLNTSLQPLDYAAWWLGTVVSSGGGSPTSATAGGFTYFRGSFRERRTSEYGADDYYGIYRTSSSTTNINTGIPTSGQISISQFYGAEQP